MGQTLNPVVRPIAPPPAQQVPPGSASTSPNERRSKEAQVGVDLFYNITPSLRTNLTVNTDFAQTQVDARQTNLTRFSLLFPEQRDFFLDGSLFFNVQTGGGRGGGGASRGRGGGGGQTLIPCQSRRIGLDEENTPQRINFGDKLTGQAGALEIDTHSQDSIQLHVLPTYELLEGDFTIAPDVTLRTGQEYGFTRYRVEGRTAPRRPISVSPQVEWGEFFSGDRLRLNTTVNLRAAPGHFYTFTHEWNRVSLAEGEFTTTLYRAIAETQFNPRISLVNNVQYDTQSAVIGWQLRFRWIVTPGSDFYFVYIHNWLDDPVTGQTYTLDRRLSSKVLYTHRF